MLKRTPFFEQHQQAGAKLIDFGGFEMPVQYSGIKKEHEAVRTAAGIFDVSHMGEVLFKGPNAKDAVQYLTVNDVEKLVPGKAQYSAMCYEDGGIVDDLIVYMISDQEYLLVVNASNKDKDLNWMISNNPHKAEIVDISDDTCLLAVQGPKSIEILQKLTDIPLDSIKFYTFVQGVFCGYPDVIISATGYTGEKGFELYFNKNTVSPANIWNRIMEAGEDSGLLPAGLGARDTLRLEMGYALYGNDISKDTNSLEAGLGWITKLDKGEFIGRDALLKVKETGVSRKLTGFVTDQPRDIPRNGYRIADEHGSIIGVVTSGTQSITEVKGVGMGYVATSHTTPGSRIMIEIRGKFCPATTAKAPFITR